MWETSQAYPDRKWLSGEAQEPPKPELWHGFYWTAWHSLRFDRPYVGQMAIEMPILYTAIDRYAVRNSVVGDQFDILLKFVSVIDDAYRDQVTADREAAMEEAKKGREPPSE